jgi:predicted GNAT family acetyltransferase
MQAAGDQELDRLVAAIPEGWSRTTVLGQSWSVSRTTHAGGKVVSITAERLADNEQLGANVWITSEGTVLKPCEIPAETIMEFLRAAAAEYATNTGKVPTMTSEADQLRVRKDEKTRLYEAVLGDEVIGSLAYETVAGQTALTHSFVDPAHRNKGVGSALAEFALSDLTGSGVRPLVSCGFVSDYVDAHPDWTDAVDISRWGMIPTRSTSLKSHGTAEPDPAED